MARIEKDGETELFNHYIAMCLYAISNQSKMTKTFMDITKTQQMQRDTRSGKEVAEDVAAKMGITINWDK